MMPYSLPRRYEKPDVSITTAVLTAFFVSSFILLLVMAFFPLLPAPYPAVVFFLLLMVALVNVVYFLSVQELNLPFLVHVLFFTGGQWLFVAVWLWLTGEAGLPAAFNPLVMMKKERLRLFVTIITSILSMFIAAPAGRLQRIPRVESSSGRRIMWEETTNRVDISSWEAEWRSCRIWVIFLIICGIFVRPLGGLFIPERKMDHQAGFFWPVLLVVTGLLLLTQFYFFYKRALWKGAGMEADRELKRTWLRWAVLITGGAAGVSLLLPAGFPGLGSIIAGFFQKMMGFFAGESPAPEIFTPPVETGTLSRGVDTQPGLLDMIITFIFIICIYVIFPLFILTCLLTIAGWILFRLGRGEIDRWKGLRKTLVKFFLFWRNLWTRLRLQQRPQGKKGVFAANGGSADRRRKKRKRLFWGRGYRAVIRRGYFRLVYQARRQGLPWRNSQTPGEIAGRLKEALPGEENTIDELTGGYRLARYSPREPSRLLAKAFEHLRRAVQKRLSGL